MAQFITPADPQIGDNRPDRPIPAHPPELGANHRGPLRHLLIGEPALVREVIRQIHLRRYSIDQRFWSPLLSIPETGLLIPPYPGQILAYLQRPEHLR